MELSLENKISALYLCADILDYPEKNYFEILKTVENLTGKKFNSLEVDLEDLCAQHIRIFSINSTKFRCTPYASWWLDGKMSGKSLLKIINFYARCGYEFDAGSMKKPADNLSSMISFIAILAEEKKFEEIREFSKFLTWTNDLVSSLNRVTNIEYFSYAVDTSIKIINSFKERL